MTEELPEPQLRPEEPRPRRPQTLGGLCYLVAVGGTGVGLVQAAVGTWRPGLAWMGGSMLFAAVARLLVPDHLAGMLKVRRKALDVVGLTVLGIALLAMAAAVPNAGPVG